MSETQSGKADAGEPAKSTASETTADQPGASTSPALAPSSPWQGLDGLMPVLLFMVLNSTLGLTWAIVGATVWSIKSAVTRRRKGIPIGRFLPIVVALIIGRGIIGVVTDSEAVYFGLGIATKFAIALALAISVVIGRSVISRVAPYVFGFDEETQAHPSYRSAMAHITLVGSAYYFISATFDIWLFNNASTNQYVFVRFIVNWVFTTVAIVGSAYYLNRRLREIPGLPGIMTMIEQRVEEQAASFGWDLSEDDDPSPETAQDQPKEEQ